MPKIKDKVIKMVEVQGWVKDKNGDVILVAHECFASWFV